MEDMFVKCVLLLIVTIIMLFVLYFVCVFPCKDSYFYIPDLIDKFMDKYFGKYTNGDWIRSMSDEELAEFLQDEASFVCNYCEYNRNDSEKEACHVCSKEFEIDVLRRFLAADYEEGLYD